MHDLILTKGNIIDVRSRRIFQGDVMIKDGIIVRIGSSSGEDAKQVIDISGQYISPGLIDSHLHIESSMLSPLEFSIDTALPLFSWTRMRSPMSAGEKE